MEEMIAGCSVQRVMSRRPPIIARGDLSGRSDETGEILAE
jgi:hypothetical protein